MYSEVDVPVVSVSAGGLAGVIVAGLLATSGCTPSYVSVEEACREVPPSPRGASQASVQSTARVNCHRRYLGLRELRFQEELQTAAQSHTDYVLTHGVADPVDVHAEDPTLEGSLGATLTDRLLALDVDVTLPGQNRALEVVAPILPESPSRHIIDRMMRDPAAAPLLLAPGATMAGFGRADSLITGVLLAGTPSNEAVREPVVWPASGQQGVARTGARSWHRLQVMDLPDDIASDPTAFPGHAITVMVGGIETIDTVEGSNYGLLVDSETLIFAGPDGPHPVRVLGPGHFQHDTDAVHIVPLAPLAPETTYTLDVDLSWGSAGRTQSLSMWFRTAEE